MLWKPSTNEFQNNTLKTITVNNFHISHKIDGRGLINSNFKN